MLEDYTKLLITSYIDGELTPGEVADLKQVLEWSADARDYLQGHLLVVQRLRQALNSPKTSVSGRTRPITAQLLLQAAAKERQAQKYGYWPAAALVVAASLVLWLGIARLIEGRGNADAVAEAGKASQTPESPRQTSKLQKPAQAGSDRPAERSNAKELHPEVASTTKEGAATKTAQATTPPTESGVASESNDTHVASGIPAEPEAGGDILFGAPIGPTLTLKKVDLVLPQVVKLRDLDPVHLCPTEGKGGEILRLDLPTYQELEGLKRIVKTLQAEGCKTLFDPGTEDRLKRNLPVGPVVLTIHGLDPAKLCLALQNTSKVVSGKPGPNQPVSVFEEAIIGTLHPREAEALGLMVANSSAKTFPGGSAGAVQTKKGTRSNLNQEPFVLIQSASLLKMLNSPLKPKPATLGSEGKPPIVVQIFPLK